MSTEKGTKNESRLHFWLMSLGYKFRDLLLPRMEVLKEVGILMGESGKVYALDKSPFAVAAVSRLAAGKGLPNVQTILSDCDTGLPSGSIDVVILYDVIHHLDDRGKVLAELHRVLKGEGLLSVSDHHLKRDELVRAVTEGGLFKLSLECKRTYRFLKKRDWREGDSIDRTKASI